ncbi:uncharacterized protein JCM6883_007263 [Sporobolomyces salmoneus]|uniref:uncharacterized protein n=1 Tax=Sporobolomyces salmoneus TaxID=183962 RepID=UPI00316ED5AA
MTRMDHTVSFLFLTSSDGNRNSTDLDSSILPAYRSGSTLCSQPSSSEAYHIGKRIVPLTETQDFEYKAAGTEVPKHHRLVVLVKKTPWMPKILHETLLDRGKRYPPLLEELSDFPKTSTSRPRPPRPAQPGAPAITPPAQPAATTSAAIAPVEQTAPRDEDETTSEVSNRVTDGRVAEKKSERVLGVKEVVSFGSLNGEGSDAGDTFEWRNFDRGERQDQAEN